jgi:chromosomal replication initiation ATPase DnaA
MANARVPEQTMMNYFQKLFIGSLHAISNSDEEFLREYLEKNLVDKILKSNKQLEENNLFLKVVSDIENKDQGIPTFCEIIDGLLIKGITSDREKNGDASQYHTWSDLDDMGITVYTHNKYSNPQNFIDPKENQSMFDDYEKVLVRLLLSIKTPYVLNIVKAKAREENPNFENKEGGDEEWNPHDYDIYGSQSSSKDFKS